MVDIEHFVESRARLTAFTGQQDSVTRAWQELQVSKLYEIYGYPAIQEFQAVLAHSLGCSGGFNLSVQLAVNHPKTWERKDACYAAEGRKDFQPHEFLLNRKSRKNWRARSRRICGLRGKTRSLFGGLSRAGD